MAGRLPGTPKTGGRKKGVPNKATIERQAEVAASGLTPLEFMLQVMRTGSDEARQLDAAKAAAPYVHPRLAAVEHSGEMRFMSHEQWLESLE